VVRNGVLRAYYRCELSIRIPDYLMHKDEARANPLRRAMRREEAAAAMRLDPDGGRWLGSIPAREPNTDADDASITAASILAGIPEREADTLHEHYGLGYEPTRLNEMARRQERPKHHVYIESRAGIRHARRQGKGEM
jgi:hypothetical protein